ncbi:unnamed protein product [Calicophoron daubneyi]|uniref:Delta-aminolevulinic acid dehydratase n=1 Tax=Calicophoron daubneyi TaxID=300641 RepID=A0AAV2TH71_CALDB
MPSSWLHGGYSSRLLRQWQSACSELRPENFVYPLFLSEDPDAFEEIPSLITEKRIGINRLQSFLAPLVAKKLSAVLLFGVVGDEHKDSFGSFADHEQSVVVSGIKLIKWEFPSLIVICDVCLCEYTDHGHCGILRADGGIDNESSLKRLSEVATKYALAGADVIAPSDMMDGRVHAIKMALSDAGLSETVSVMSYASKFASSFYGPFRDAAKSTPRFGDRRGYQLPSGARGLAVRAALRDAEEGADFIMVKPGLIYLDILNEIRHQLPNHTLAVYHVSGEYAMLMHAAKAGAVDLKQAALEIMTSFRRAGASIIVTYLTPYLLDLDLNDACR